MKKDYAEIHGYSTWRLMTLVAALAILSVTMLAQTQTQPASTAIPKPPPRPEDEISNKMRTARNDPPQYVELIVKLVKEFPDSMAAESAGYSFASAIKKQAKLDNDPGKLRSLADRFIEGMASAPPQLRVRANNSAIGAMLDNDLAPQAFELARQTIPLLNEKDFFEFRRKGYERDIERASKANPNYKPRPFNETDSIELFLGTKATAYAQLGRALLKLDKIEEAEQAYKQAFEVEPNAPAAIGIATILQKRGKDKEALEYMVRGVLTGKMRKNDIVQFHDLYRKTHGGSLDGTEEYLDAHYRESYRNPVKAEKNERAPSQTDRVVLAEFFTGAGCVPCIPFDYSFETDLEDYTRRELAVLVYHWHAPTMDPLGNCSTDARVKYYGINSAPNVFLDGKKFVTQDDDLRSKTEAGSTAERVHAALNSKINADLKTPPQGKIKLDAKQVGVNIEASVIEGRVDPLSGAARFSFASQIIEFVARVGAEVANDTGIDFSFKEEKNVINPDNLSVVAFLQDDKSKEILQSVYLRVPQSGKGGK